MPRKAAKEITLDAEVPEEYKTLKTSLQENKTMLDALFQDVDIMLNRSFKNAENTALNFCVYFSDGVSDSALINEHIIKLLILAEGLHKGRSLYPAVRDHVEMSGDMKETSDVQEIVEAITYGDTLLLVDGSDTGLIISSKAFNLRGISEPEGEKALSGPGKDLTRAL